MIVGAAFVILTALLLWDLARDARAWKRKAVLIVCVPLFGFVVWWSLQTYRGWPAAIDVPPGAFIAGVIREPSEGDPGRIYLWIQVGDKPRAFSIPYSRSAHKNIHRAGVMRLRGPVVLIPRQAYRPYRLPPPAAPKGAP